MKASCFRQLALPQNGLSSIEPWSIGMSVLSFPLPDVPAYARSPGPRTVGTPAADLTVISYNRFISELFTSKNWYTVWYTYLPRPHHMSSSLVLPKLDAPEPGVGKYACMPGVTRIQGNNIPAQYLTAC